MRVAFVRAWATLDREISFFFSPITIFYIFLFTYFIQLRLQIENQVDPFSRIQSSTYKSNLTTKLLKNLQF